MGGIAGSTRRTPLPVEAILAEGPEWLRHLRSRAWELYLETPLPGPRDEAWRRTSLAAVDLDALLTAAPEDGPAPDQARPDWAPEAGGAAGRLTLPIPGTAEAALAPEAAEQGVIFTDLLTAAREYPDLVRSYLGRLIPPEASKFAALNAAVWRHGLFGYVPAGVEVRLPLWSTVCCGAAAAIHRTLLVAEPGSSVTCVETLISAPDDATGAGQAAFHCGVAEIFAGPGARVTFGTLQALGPGHLSFSFRSARTDRESRVVQFTGEFGGRLVRSETLSTLEGEGGTASATVAYFATGRQHIDVVAGSVHRAPRTESSIVARGAVGGEARAVYRGTGHIVRGAKGATMSQKQRALLLSPAARADAVPSLLIDDDDVAASHAAAAAPLDPEPLFYLMSRGIRPEEARRLLVHGFFAPLLGRVPVDAVRTGLEAILDRKLGAS